MNRITFLLPTIGALALAGCHVSYTGDWSGKGALGDSCTCDEDCQDGLSCDEDVCVPDDDNTTTPTGTPSEGCQANADCPQGSFCELVSGVCVYTGSCQQDADCGDGLTCDEEVGTCVPGEDPPPPPPTCAEIALEADCSARADCVPIYAGVNCSCGPNCECKGVEPNCVCERFDYFACAAVG
jgi:hypothetical protein